MSQTMKNLTVEEAKLMFHTPKFCFTMFRKTNPSTGVVETQYCKDAEGKVIQYADPVSGEMKPLPKVAVRDTAKNIVAFCSAAVAKAKVLGGSALEGAYFQPSINADGETVYQLRKSGTSSEFDLGEE